MMKELEHCEFVSIYCGRQMKRMRVEEEEEKTTASAEVRGKCGEK